MVNLFVFSPEARAWCERVFSRSCAVVHMMRNVFLSVPSCEQYLGVSSISVSVCKDILCDTPDDSCSKAQGKLLLLCHLISFNYTFFSI